MLQLQSPRGILTASRFLLEFGMFKPFPVSLIVSISVLKLGIKLETILSVPGIIDGSLRKSRVSI